MYYCIHDYSQEKSDIFYVFSANFISKFTYHTCTCTCTNTVYLHMLPPCQEGSSAAKSVYQVRVRVAGRGWVGLALGTDY